MIVISDTTPLISFLKINRLDLLEKLFCTVQIPKGVFAELIEIKVFLLRVRFPELNGPGNGLLARLVSDERKILLHLGEGHCPLIPKAVHLIEKGTPF